MQVTKQNKCCDLGLALYYLSAPDLDLFCLKGLGPLPLFPLQGAQYQVCQQRAQKRQCRRGKAPLPGPRAYLLVSFLLLHHGEASAPANTQKMQSLSMHWPQPSPWPPGSSPSNKDTIPQASACPARQQLILGALPASEHLHCRSMVSTCPAYVDLVLGQATQKMAGPVGLQTYPVLQGLHPSWGRGSPLKLLLSWALFLSQTSGVLQSFLFTFLIRPAIQLTVLQNKCPLFKLLCGFCLLIGP